MASHQEFLWFPISLITHAEDLMPYSELQRPVYRNHFAFESLGDGQKNLILQHDRVVFHGKHPRPLVVFTFSDKLLELNVVVHHGRALTIKEVSGPMPTP